MPREQTVSGTISARRAVAVGQCVVNGPVFVIMGVFFVGAVVLKRHPVAAFVVALGGIAVAWTYWSHAVPRWRRWALRRGAPPEELQRLAVTVGLVWPKGSPFEKTEFRLGDQQHDTEERHK